MKPSASPPTTSKIGYGRFNWRATSTSSASAASSPSINSTTPTRSSMARGDASCYDTAACTSPARRVQWYQEDRSDENVESAITRYWLWMRYGYPVADSPALERALVR